MSLQEIVVAGTLKPDGTLELDRKPDLPPGRVTVVLRQESEACRPRRIGGNSCNGPGVNWKRRATPS